MGKSDHTVTAVLLAVFAWSSPAGAEDESWAFQDLQRAAEAEPQTGSSASEQKREPTPEEMQQMMGAMMGFMLEGMAKTMAKPQVAENFAIFTRNYYDALIVRGFNEEEAMKIVTSSGLPSVGNKQ